MSDTPAAFRPSPQQERLWLAEPEGPAARTQVVAVVEGLPADAVHEALRRVVARHEILRTSFARRQGIRFPLQLIHDELPPAWDVVDLTATAPDGTRERVAEIARSERSVPLDLAEGPLTRAVLARLTEERHALVLTVHALCLDVSTVPALLAALAGELGLGGAPSGEPLQYADYAEWQHELAASDDEDPKAGRRHWEERAGLVARLPLGAPAGPAHGRVDLAYDAVLAAGVRDLASRYGTTPESVVHAAWHAVLGRITGTDEVATALVHGGPGRDPLDGLVGCTARRVPVRTAVEPSATFTELLARLNRERADALAFEDYAPADAAVGVEAGFMSSEGFEAVAGAGRMALDSVHAEAGTGMALRAHDLSGAPQLWVAHDQAPDAAHQAERLAGALERVLGAVTQDPGAVIRALPVLSDQERRQVLADFNDTAIGEVPAGVWERFSRHAAGAPDAIAVDDGSTALTYGELAGRAAGLTRMLLDRGVGPGHVVALSTDRSVDMAVGVLGVLGAGAAFLPLHFEHPRARLEHQIGEAGCRVLVTQAALRGRLPETGLDLVEVDAVAPAVEPPPAPRPGPDDLAYVIFTSGSTGRPKGVGVTNANIANYADHLVRQLDAEAEPLRFGMVTALSTDLGHTALFPALCSGGTLVLVAPAEAADAAAFARRLERTPVDVLKITPSHLAALLAGQDPGVLPRRWLVFGGERLGWDVVDRLRALGDCVPLNHYGPTETTVGSCILTVPDGPGPFAPASVPIGRPISNTRCYVLDGAREPVPIGASGVLFIAGAGVARGYLGQPELTAERFSADPFAGAGERMYDTGDLARWLPDGTIEFLGRADEQLKIRGFRVEPGEVEEALRAHPAVREAAVVVREDANGAPRLIGYVVHDDGTGPDALTAHLAGLLPDYMMPAVLASLDALPRTPSGKVDRQALPEPAEPGAGGALVEPGTQLEKALAGIWEQVLGVPRVGTTDDFFALGGHSLLAAQVVAQVRSDFAVELPMHSLFMMPTVASLAAEIDRMMQSADEDETARLLENLEGLSDEDVERMLAEPSQRDER